MKKFFLLLLMLFALSGCGQNAADVSGKTFIVGIDEEFAPMTFRNEKKELVGFDIDLARAVAKRMGVTFEFKPINWDNKETEINSGNVDMIWSGFDITDEREKQLLFSKPYMDTRQILLVRRGDGDNIHSEKALAGKIVGTQAGTSSEAYVNGNDALKKSFAQFKTYTNFKDGFELLNNGEIDALICDEVAGRYEMSKYPPSLRAVEVTVGAITSFSIGFRKDDVELRDKVQSAFDAVVADGTAKEISEKWFHADLIKTN